MPNFDEFLKGKQAAQLMGDKGKLEKLRDAPETQQIFSMLSRSTGDLEAAADRAAKGDTAQLTDAIRKLMQDPEGAKLIQKMKDNLM
jgi:hypothetical protein